MGIVGGLDIHRKQITFDYVDTVTGQISCGQIGRADRARLRTWLRKNFADHDDVAFAVEACTGWRYLVEELTAANVEAHLGEPAETAAARGRKRRAKTDRSDSRLLRELLEQDRLPECWIPPAHVLECRALLQTYMDLRVEHTAWVRRIHAVCFHQGAAALDRGGVSTPKPGPAGNRPPNSSCPRPGSTKWQSPQGFWMPWRPNWRRCASSWSQRPNTCVGPTCCADRSTELDRSAGWRSPAGWVGRTGSLQRAKPSGSAGWTSPSTPLPEREPRAACPGRAHRS
jgi:hypothetical protein